MDVKLKITNNELLEQNIPIDRVITAQYGMFSLNDIEFKLDEKDIKEIICQ